MAVRVRHYPGNRSRGAAERSAVSSRAARGHGTENRAPQPFTLIEGKSRIAFPVNGIVDADCGSRNVHERITRCRSICSRMIPEPARPSEANETDPRHETIRRSSGDIGTTTARYSPAARSCAVMLSANLDRRQAGRSAGPSTRRSTRRPAAQRCDRPNDAPAPRGPITRMPRERHGQHRRKVAVIAVTRPFGMRLRPECVQRFTFSGTAHNAVCDGPGRTEFGRLPAADRDPGVIIETRVTAGPGPGIVGVLRHGPMFRSPAGSPVPDSSLVGRIDQPCWK
jgi:hypothetical protein